MGLLHYWDSMRGDVETYSIWRDKFSLLIPRIGSGSGFVDLDFTEMPLQDMIHGSGFNTYRYFSLGFQERRMQFGQDGQTFMIRVAQRQHGGSFLRLVWNPGITLVGNSTTDRVERVSPYFQEFSPMVRWVGFLDECFSKRLIEFLRY
jgi:hypothetical protein